MGKTIAIGDLPDTGSGESCRATQAGAVCEWKLWKKDGQSKGYVAEFNMGTHGQITSVTVSEHIWRAGSGA